MRLLRTALRRVGPGPALVPLALLVALGAVAVVVARPGPGAPDPVRLVCGLLAALGAAGVLLVPAVLRRLAPAEVDAVQLPGWHPAARLPSAGAVTATGSLAAALTAVLLALARPVLALVLVVVVAAAALALLVAALRRRRRAPLTRSDLHLALAAYAPQVAVYTARPNDAGYQLAMWLPQLEAMGLRHVVVVRHEHALAPARRLTQAPVVCCPSTADLDTVVVASLRVACYVNLMAQNVNFVGFGQLRHVYLGHGDSDKELSVHPAQAMFDHVFVAGPAAIQRYAAAGVHLPAEKFTVVGRPQLAGVLRAERPVAGIDPVRVLVAPTWRGYNAATRLGTVAELPALVEDLLGRGVVVRVRPHPFSRQSAEDAAVLAAVDQRLAADRARTGRPHVTAAEELGSSVRASFDGCDALVTDLGSLLVDFFATGKPYAVTLPPQLPAAEALARFPSVAAAYLVTAGTRTEALDQLLGADPLAGDRDRVAEHFLGPHPGDATPFRQALRALVDRPT